jgi:hypothetical protein
MSIESEFRDFEDRLEVLRNSYGSRGELFWKMKAGCSVCSGEREKARQEYNRIKMFEGRAS